MNINSKHVATLLAVSAMAFGVVAEAQTRSPQSQAQPGYDCPYGMGPGMMGSGGRHGHMKGDPSAFADQRLADFKGQLKITPQQEPLWQAFADKVKASAGQMKSMHENMQQPPATAPERMNRMVEFMKARTTAMEATNDSFKRLYDALSPEQKAVADKFHPFGGPMGQRRGPRGPGMGPGPQGQGPAGGPAPR